MRERPGRKLPGGKQREGTAPLLIVPGTGWQASSGEARAASGVAGNGKVRTAEQNAAQIRKPTAPLRGSFPIIPVFGRG
jgi:hypothetical protein